MKEQVYNPLQKILKRIKREFDLLTTLQIFLSFGLLIIFLVAPLSSLLTSAFFYQNQFSLKWFQDIISNPEYVSFKPRGGRLFEVIRGTMYIWGYDYGILVNSLIIAISVTILCSIIGTFVAMIMGRYEFRGKNILKVLLLIPLLATPFVNAFVIGKIFNPREGLINYIFFDLLHILPWRIDIDGIVGLIVAQTLSYYPIVYLNTLSSLNNIDPSLEEMAENLGAKGFRLFRTITLPLFLPGLLAGAIITFIFSLEDLGAPVGFIGARANPLAKKVASYQIFSSFAEALTGGISPKTIALALIIMITTVASYFLIKKITSLRSYTMLSKGGRWSPRVREPSILVQLGIIATLIILIVFAAIPQLGTFLLATTDWATSGTLPQSFTIEHFSIITTNSNVLSAITNSLIYSVIAVIIMILVGTSISYIVAKRNLPGNSILDALATLPVAIPGVSLAVSYFIFFTSGSFRRSIFDPILDPGLLLIIAYSVRRLPFTMRSISAGLQQVDKSLEEASLNLGASRFTTLFRIVIPLVISHVISGAILSFVYSMAEVSTSVTLGALREDRVPITFFISQIVYGIAAVGSVSIGAALVVMLMTVQITAMAISNYVLKQKVAFLGV